MNLSESVRRWVLANLPYDRADQELEAYLTSQDAHRLLVIYHNWMSRQIRPAPRRVHRSASFKASLASSPHAAAVEQILSDIEAGHDLRKYLSRGVDIAAQIPRQSEQFNRRRDLDLLLMTWQIHHLHLGEEIEEDGFVSRTKDLLFVVFRRNDAYVVDIVGHGGWYRDDLLRILLNELPGSDAVFELKGVVGLSREPDEADMRALRNGGVNTAHMIDGKAVMPAGLLTAAGTTDAAVRNTDDLLERIETFEAQWNEQPEKLRAQFAAQGIVLPDSPLFEFMITEHGPGVYEPVTRAFVPLLS